MDAFLGLITPQNPRPKRKKESRRSTDLLLVSAAPEMTYVLAGMDAWTVGASPRARGLVVVLENATEKG